MEQLPISEELDFQYLLQLLPPLTGNPEFAWLPELFSIIGARNLITLCKYAGGETIRIPTQEELSLAIDALQWYYDVYISRKKSAMDIPQDLVGLVAKIQAVYSQNC